MERPRENGQTAREARKRTWGSRLVPPRPTSLEALDGVDAEAEGWAKGLHGGKRVWAVRIVGNGLMLFLLLGVPWLRGVSRARHAQDTYARVAACLAGADTGSAPGLGADVREAEHFAAELVRRPQGWPGRCVALLDRFPEPALFVLPSVKQAEARVHEAVAILREELSAVPRYRVGMAMPRRPLQALELMRTSIAEQVEQATFFAAPVQSAVAFGARAGLPTPARVPLYAGHDAALSIAGDDHALSLLAIDRTGLSYLEVVPGKPFVRARLTRPRLLHGLVAEAGASWLVWATPEARCAERVTGCHGKTTGVAQVTGALLELPEPRHLAAHLVGRVDRSLASLAGRLLLAARTASGRVGIREFALPAGFPVQGELPPLPPRASWPDEVESALVLRAERDLVVLGTRAEGDLEQLERLGPGVREGIASLGGAGAPWLTGCAAGEEVRFAFGRADRMQVGRLRAQPGEGWEARRWGELAVQTRDVIDPTNPQADAVVVLCDTEQLLVLARDSERTLHAVACEEQQASCRVVELARAVDGFSAVDTRRGVLIAYAGSETPQIMLRRLSREPLVLTPASVPGACWDLGATTTGMCARPLLTRHGSRILLSAREGSDMVMLESADDGSSWSTPPTL